MADPLKPTPALLAALGSIVAHIEEGAGHDGHHFDIITARTLCNNTDVQAWMKEMRKLALVPVRRKK